MKPSVSYSITSINMSKVFNDYKAKRKFLDIYGMLEMPARKIFCDKINAAAAKKVETDSDDETEFYLNEKDVENCLQEVPLKELNDNQ